MEFFDLFNFTNTLTQLIRGTFDFTGLWVSVGLGAGLYLICLILGGFGLYTMAKKVGMKYGWLGFIPFANTFYAGKVAGEANFFGQKMKCHGLYAMLAEIVYVVLSIGGLLTSVFLSNDAYWVEEVAAGGGFTQTFNPELVPAEYQWVVTADKWFTLVSYLVFIVVVVLMCVVYFAVFRKYYMRSPVLMTFLSVILPFRGIVLFAVRKNTPVDYNAIMKKRMEQIYRAQNPNYQPPDTNSPFSEFSGNAGSTGREESPFSEFDGGSDKRDE